jgi:hypothetical protein
MTVYTTRQGCKVETTYAIMANGGYQENVTLSVDPASTLALVVEKRASLDLDRPVVKRGPFGDPQRYRK